MFTIKDHYDSILFNDETLNIFTGIKPINSIRRGTISSTFVITNQDKVIHINLPVIAVKGYNNTEELQVKSIIYGLESMSEYLSSDIKRIYLYTHSVDVRNIVNRFLINLERVDLNLLTSYSYLGSNELIHIAKIGTEFLNYHIRIQYVPAILSNPNTIITMFYLVNGIYIEEKDAIEIGAAYYDLKYRIDQSNQLLKVI